MGELGLLDVAGIPPLLLSGMIFCARIADVSIGTLRIIVVGRGMRTYAALLGFMEVLIWLLAISVVMQNLHGWLNYFMYSAGFAAGTFVGMTIERRIAWGTSLVRIVVPSGSDHLVRQLEADGFRVTQIDAKGDRGPVLILFSVVKRRLLRSLLQTVRGLEPSAVYSVEDVRAAGDASPELGLWTRGQARLQPFFWFRKSK